jgi:tRNA nucleotidyltransferase/poly(A) polymerase
MADPKEIILFLSEVAKELSYPIFICGGYCWKHFLGMIPAGDIDVCVDHSDLQKVLDYILANFNAKLITQKSEKTRSIGSFSIIVEIGLVWYTFDFCSRRSETYDIDSRIPKTRPGSVEEDQARRDFTICSILFNPQDCTYLHFQSSYEDTKNGTLKTNKDPCASLDEDPFRAFRAIRICSSNGLKLDPQLEKALMDPRLALSTEKKLSPELINAELENIFKHENASTQRLAVELLIKTPLFSFLFGKASNISVLSREPAHPKSTDLDVVCCFWLAICLFISEQENNAFAVLTKLRWPKKIIKKVVDLIYATNLLDSLTNIRIGLFFDTTKLDWEFSLELARTKGLETSIFWEIAQTQKLVKFWDRPPLLSPKQLAELGIQSNQIRKVQNDMRLKQMEWSAETEEEAIKRAVEFVKNNK